MQTVHRRLKGVFRAEVTPRLLEAAIKETEDSLYYEDFLGTNDVTESGMPIVIHTITIVYFFLRRNVL